MKICEKIVVVYGLFVGFLTTHTLVILSCMIDMIDPITSVSKNLFSVSDLPVVWIILVPLKTYQNRRYIDAEQPYSGKALYSYLLQKQKEVSARKCQAIRNQKGAHRNCYKKELSGLLKENSDNEIIRDSSSNTAKTEDESNSHSKDKDNGKPQNEHEALFYYQVDNAVESAQSSPVEKSAEVHTDVTAIPIVELVSESPDKDVSQSMPTYIGPPQHLSTNSLYRLVGVISHRGLAYKEHYRSYVRERVPTHSWILVDDASVQLGEINIPLPTLFGPLRKRKISPHIMSKHTSCYTSRNVMRKP